MNHAGGGSEQSGTDPGDTDWADEEGARTGKVDQREGGHGVERAVEQRGGEHRLRTDGQVGEQRGGDDRPTLNNLTDNR